MLTKHDERKMPKNLGHIESLARSYTDTAIKTLAGIMMEQTSPPMARIVAAKVLVDRGRGKPNEKHHTEGVDNKTPRRDRNQLVDADGTAGHVQFQGQNPTVRDHPEQKWRQYSLTAFPRPSLPNSSHAAARVGPPRPAFPGFLAGAGRPLLPSMIDYSVFSRLRRAGQLFRVPLAAR